MPSSTRPRAARSRSGETSARAGARGRRRLGNRDPRPHQSRVFDRFYRVDPARSGEVDGTGLGLAICRAIALAHGGSISIESDAGKGCTVTVQLPIGPIENGEHEPPRCADQARPLLYSIRGV